MSGGRTFSMPNRRETLRRLGSVNSCQHVVQYLHPRIADHSSLDMAAAGIVTMFLTEIEAYCTRFENQVMAKAMTLLVPSYIKALVRDKRVRDEALKVFKQVTS